MNELEEIKMELYYIKKFLGLYTYGPCGNCSDKWVAERGWDCGTCGVPLCTQCIKKCSECKKRSCDQHHHQCDYCGCGYCMKCMYICKVCGPICPESLKNDICPTCNP